MGLDSFRILGGNGETGDGFAAIEYTGRPEMPGPPPHLHRTFDEAWYILEGEVEFTLPQGRHLAGAGEYVLIPRGVRHTFQVRGRAPARWLGLFSPGRHVQLLVDLAEVIPAAGPPEPERVLAVFAAHDTELA
jgi:quercetin dioxygenase-like cupin family protein